MKKFKLILMSVAIIGAVSGAFATMPSFECFNQPQYYYTSATGYQAAGTIGFHYFCSMSPEEVCTYILSGGQYVACQIGRHVPIQ